MRQMKTTMLAAAAFVVALFLLNSETENHLTPQTGQQEYQGQDRDILAQAFQNRQSDVQVKGLGIVDRILSDDNKGSRHQRFILRLASGQTILIAHNIDLAPKIHSLTKGDTVEFFGEYEWNAKGGVVHWTHHDPRNKHIDGWLKHNGQIYQ
jgi:hypothetical protein